MFTQVYRYPSVRLGFGHSSWVGALLLALAVTLAPACSRKSGCPVNEPAKLKTDKDGNIKSAKGASNLFPKDMRRRVRRN